MTLRWTAWIVAGTVGAAIESTTIRFDFDTRNRPNVMVCDNGDLVLLSTGSGSEECQAEGADLVGVSGQCGFVERRSASGERRYKRPLAYANAGFQTSERDGRVWISALEGVWQHDLAPNGGPFIVALLDIRQGLIVTSARINVAWLGGVPVSGPGFGRNPRRMNSLGELWMGGVATTPIPVTPDAAQPWYVGTLGPRQYPGSLLKIAADGSRVEYATYLGDGLDAVTDIVVNDDDTVYAVGSRIWKFSASGRLLWSTWLPPGAAMTAASTPAGDLLVGGCTLAPTGFFTTFGTYGVPEGNVEPLRFIDRSYFPNLCYNAFLAKFSGAGELIFSTLLGSGWLNSVETTFDGDIVLAGRFSIPSHDLTWAGEENKFVPMRAWLNPAATTLKFADALPGGLLTGMRYRRVGADLVNIGDTRGRTFGGRGMPDRPLIEISYLRAAEPGRVRIDGLERLGTLNTSYRILVRGEGFCAAPIVTVDGMPVPVVSHGENEIQVQIDPPIPAPQTDAIAGAAPETYYFGFQVVCGKERSQTVWHAFPIGVPSESGIIR